jgi:hypothetical protein
MQGKAKTATCLFFGMLAVGLVSEPEFARSKTSRLAKQKFTAARASSVSAQPEIGKVILVLQTRDHQVTVRGGDGQTLRYSVATHQGIALADGLSVSDLKARFPEVHEIVTGTAWAGL